MNPARRLKVDLFVHVSLVFGSGLSSLTQELLYVVCHCLPSGGIDALVYSTGIGPLARLVDLDADTWRRAFDTNVVGAALVTAAAIPYLAESRGVAVYLSTVSASETPPWPGLGAYAVSKAALDKLVEAWRAEHPAIGFTRVVAGDCTGGEGPSQVEFNRGWAPELAGEVVPIWAARGW